MFHSNETRAPIANPPDSTELGAPPTVLPSYIWVRAVVWACGEGQTHRQTRVTNIHFASSTTHTNVISIPTTEVIIYAMVLSSLSRLTEHQEQP